MGGADKENGQLYQPHCAACTAMIVLAMGMLTIILHADGGTVARPNHARSRAAWVQTRQTQKNNDKSDLSAHATAIAPKALAPTASTEEKAGMGACPASSPCKRGARGVPDIITRTLSRSQIERIAGERVRVEQHEAGAGARNPRMAVIMPLPPTTKHTGRAVRALKTWGEPGGTACSQPRAIADCRAGQ